MDWVPEHIVAVNFTYALPEGMWVERRSGSKSWMHFNALRDEVGDKELARLRIFADGNGMTGMWYNADSGKNCFEAGVRVA